jgi:hypothetical protein
VVVTLLVQWRPRAKEGADLPDLARAPRLARQIIEMGETYDYEFVPPAIGPLQIEVRGAGPQAGCSPGCRCASSSGVCHAVTAEHGRVA